MQNLEQEKELDGLGTMRSQNTDDVGGKDERETPSPNSEKSSSSSSNSSNGEAEAEAERDIADIERTPSHQHPSTSPQPPQTISPETHDEKKKDKKKSKRNLAPDEPPNGGIGWVMITACATINAHTWGMNSSYGVFLAHYLANDVFPSATPLDYAFVGGLSISQALFVSPIATVVTRRFGTRTTLMVGVFFETLAFIGASFATSIWHLFLTQGVCFGWGMGFLFVGSVVIAPQWFTTRRSLANGVSAAGSGLGGLVYSLAAQALIRNLSLAWAFRVFGIIACVVNFSCAMVVRDRNKQIGSTQLAFHWRLFKRSEFLGLQAFGVLSMLGYIVLLFSLPNYARTIGLTAKQGSIVGAVLNLGQAVGRPPIGYWSDTFGRVNMAASMTFLCGVFCLLIWMFANSFGVLILFALAGGSVAGTFWAIVSPVWTEIMGLVDLPSALNITWLVLVVPTTVSEAVALKIVEFNGGGYEGAIVFTGVMYIGAAVFLWLVRTWKIGELERVARVKQEDPASVDPLADVVGEGREVAERVGAEEVKIRPFVKRLFVWQKV